MADDDDDDDSNEEEAGLVAVVVQVMMTGLMTGFGRVVVGVNVWRGF